jgi:hypothetical protein
MIKGNCPKCGENIFDVPDFESLGGRNPVKLTCSGCGSDARVRRTQEGSIVYYLAGHKRRIPVIEYNRP